MLWNAVSFITLDKAVEVFPEGFENHADVSAMGAFMEKWRKCSRNEMTWDLPG